MDLCPHVLLYVQLFKSHVIFLQRIKIKTKHVLHLAKIQSYTHFVKQTSHIILYIYISYYTVQRKLKAVEPKTKRSTNTRAYFLCDKKSPTSLVSSFQHLSHNKAETGLQAHGSNKLSQQSNKPSQQ